MTGYPRARDGFPRRVDRRWIFPDGTTLPVISGGAVDDGEATAEGGESTPPTQLDDDHPLVKAHQAKKSELATTKAALSAANQRITELESTGKSDADKQAERIARLEKDAADARTEALRMRIAAKHKISDEDAELFLTATDEDTLTRQAKRLAETAAEKRKGGNVVPGEGKTSKSPGGDDASMREFTRNLFSRAE